MLLMVMRRFLPTSAFLAAAFLLEQVAACFLHTQAPLRKAHFAASASGTALTGGPSIVHYHCGRNVDVCDHNDNRDLT